MTMPYLAARHLLMVSIAALTLLAATAFAASAKPMLFYQVQHDLLTTSDHFTVTVYTDGVAVVHYPDSMVNAGDYAVQLSPNEVQEIRLLLEHPLVQSFDAASTRNQKQQIDAESSELFHISDDSWSSFDINLGDSQRSIRWANVGLDANRYPQIGVLRKLADIEDKLLSLSQHPSAEVVSD